MILAALGLVGRRSCSFVLGRRRACRWLGSLLDGLAGPRQRLFGRAEVTIAQHVELPEHVQHLLLSFGIGNLEIAEIVEQAAEFLLQAFFAIAHPAADLALDHAGVVQIIALGAGKLIGPGQRAGGFFDRRDRLALHGQNPGDLFTQLATAIVKLASRVLFRDDAEP